MSHEVPVIPSGSILTAKQVKSFKEGGVRDVLLVIDMDDEVACINLEGNIRALLQAGLRVWVIRGDTPSNNSDESSDLPDCDGWKESLSCEWWCRWISERIASKYDLTTDDGFDQALAETAKWRPYLQNRSDYRMLLGAFVAALRLSEKNIPS